VNSTGERLIGAYRRLSPTTKAIALIVLVVLLANGMYVFGLANGDPISWTAGSRTTSVASPADDRPSIPTSGS
jgi:hypothetical protein